MTARTQPTTLAVERAKRGLSQRALAHMAGVSVATIAKAETQGRTPYLRTQYLIAGALGLEPEDVFPRGAA